MNIEVQVDEITLSTIVGEIVSFDEDGEPYSDGGGKTVADLVAERIVTKLVQDERWPSLRDRITQIRDEEIRAAVRPAIDEAINRPIKKTNHYGEATGQETTLSEVIVEEARKIMTQPADRYRSEQGTVLQQTVRAEVKNAFDTQIVDAVKTARDLVSGQIGTIVSEQIQAAVRAGLAKR
ncbi:hypothetical protein [Streptomyces sp. NPDC060184]|uniref:hypothetical protein n=1 Tax=Streptomyces sp. NPDC060184 TaxID=3347064 RepID=UPI00364F6AE0